MAAGDVWDYIFGSYVNAVRALPYINDGVIVIRRLNARGAGTKPRRLSRSREGERADRCTALRVAHGDALWNTADSHGISNEVDKIGRRGRGDHEIGMRISRHRWNRVLQLGETGDAITGCDPWRWRIRREQLEKMKQTWRDFGYKLNEESAKFGKVTKARSLHQALLFSSRFLNI